VVGVNLEDLFEIRERVVIAIGVEHLGLLDLVHETAVAVGIRDDYAGLGGEAVGDDHVVYLLEQDLLCVLYKRLVFLGKEFLNFSLAFSVIWHLEISFSDIDDILD